MSGGARVLLAVAVATLFATVTPGFVRDEAVFPGRVVDWASERHGDALAVLVLVAPKDPEAEPPGDDVAAEPKDPTGEPEPDPLPPCEGDGARRPLTLYRWVVADGSRPAVLREDLPYDAVRIASVDLDRDGVGEIVMDTPRGRVRLGADPNADRVVLARSWISVLDDPRVAVPAPGRLTVFAPGEDGKYREIGRARLPVEATVGRWRTRVRTPAVVSRGTTAEGDRLLVMQAESVGTRRVRTGLVRVPDAGPIAVEECWARLPEAEDLMDREVVLFDGVPLLVTTTKEAGKLGLLVEKRLRVHPLRADRSRLGVEPLLAVESRMNLWQEPRFSSSDIDGDGRADLAAAYWKGLKDSRLVIDVYLRNEDGSFREKARSTAFDVEDGDRSWLRYGDDLDGDGHPELVVRSGDRIHVHRGVPSPKGAKVVEPYPVEIPLEVDGLVGETVVTVSVGGGPGGVGTWSSDDGPRIVDLGGAPAMVVRGTRGGTDVLQVVRLGAEDD